MLATAHTNHLHTRSIATTHPLLALFTSRCRMGTKLTILTTKLSKIQSSDGGDDSAVEETIARLQLQNRELQRKNAELADRAHSSGGGGGGGLKPKRSASSARGGGAAGRKAPTRPRSGGGGGGLAAASANSWAPSGASHSLASSDAIESKLRTILQERDMQIRQLEDERERLRAQISSGAGSEGSMKELQHNLQSKQSQLDLVESKFEQLDSSFKALRSNHEKALQEFDALNKELVAERRNSVSVKHDRKVLEVTQDQVKTLEEEVEKLRQQKARAEDENKELLEKAMSGQATQQYKEQINVATHRIKELSRANNEMETSVKAHADEVGRLKEKLSHMEKSHGSYQVRPALPRPPIRKQESWHTERTMRPALRPGRQSSVWCPRILIHSNCGRLVVLRKCGGGLRGLTA